MKRISVGTLIFTLSLPLLTGMISAALSSQAMAEYGSMSKPFLSPPAWVFSAAWTILYILMGLASYFVIVSEADVRSKSSAMFFYLLQLIFNFMWSIIFFNWGMYLLAFIWLLILWFLVIICALCFFRISQAAAFLMFPYILWLTFAAYLNLGAYLIKTGVKQ